MDQYVEADGYRYEDRNPVVEVKEDESIDYKSRFSRTVQSTAGDYVNAADVQLWEYMAKSAAPDFDAAKNPMSTAHAQGFAHFTAALGSMNGTVAGAAQRRPGFGPSRAAQGRSVAIRSQL